MNSNRKIIVLRYSDFDTPKINTIEEHKKMLQSHDSVLWGWFRKPYENLVKQPDAIDSSWEYIKYSNAIERMSFPSRIYLCNMSKKEVYIANCLGVRNFDTINEEVKIKIPTYYRNSKTICFWFELASIEQYDYTQFYNEFKNTINFSSDDTILTKSKPSISKIIKTNGHSILHISDIHFGSSFNYRMNDASHRNFPDLLKKIKNNINIISDYNIGVIVASGDFSFGKDADKSNNFNEAKKFLKELCDLLNLDCQQHLIIVPGNHDKGFIDENEHYDQFSTLDEKMANNYDDYYKLFKKELVGDDQITYVKKYELSNHIKINFLALDSSDFQTIKKREYGFIDTRQLETIEEWNANSDEINMAVFHYPFVPPPAVQKISYHEDVNGKYHSDALSVLENSYEIASILTEKGFKYILHGHQHFPYFGKYILRKKEGTTNTIFLSAGSLGLDISNQYSEFPHNSFNIYTINKDIIDVHVFRFLQGDPPNLYDSFSIINGEFLNL